MLQWQKRTRIPQAKRYAAVRGGRDPREKTGLLVSVPTHSHTTGITLTILLVADKVGEVENRRGGRQRKKELGHKMPFQRAPTTLKHRGRRPTSDPALPLIQDGASILITAPVPTTSLHRNLWNFFFLLFYTKRESDGKQWGAAGERGTLPLAHLRPLSNISSINHHHYYYYSLMIWFFCSFLVV